jgi:hypothetical protein
MRFMTLKYKNKEKKIFIDVERREGRGLSY